jgi:ribosomal 30S subunit maturation factor RimM
MITPLKLLGAAGLAASLIAMPAFAANNGGANGGNNGAFSSSNATPLTPNGGNANAATATANNNTAATPATGASTSGVTPMANSVVGGKDYANVGLGGYTADQMFITTGNNNNNNNNNGNNGNNNNWRPSQRNPVLADNGDVRASKMVGTDVYNADNKKLGSINDILIGKNGVWAVISTNNKKVAVHFDQLEFGNAVNNGNDKIVLPNETEAKLNTLPAFHYNVTNYQNVNNDGGPANANGNNNG